MCVFDGCEDTAKFYRQTDRAARKPYKCSECGRDIGVGERYRYVAALWNDDRTPHSIRTCAHCAIGQDWLIRECGGFMHDAVEEDLREHVSAGTVFDHAHGYGSGPARIVIGMRRKWRQFNGPALMPVPAIPAVTAH